MHSFGWTWNELGGVGSYFVFVFLYVPFICLCCRHGDRPEVRYTRSRWAGSNKVLVSFFVCTYYTVCSIRILLPGPCVWVSLALQGSVMFTFALQQPDTVSPPPDPLGTRNPTHLRSSSICAPSCFYKSTNLFHQFVWVPLCYQKYSRPQIERKKIWLPQWILERGPKIGPLAR